MLLDGKHHMLPPSGDLYIYGVEKSDGRMAYRCRTKHRFDSGLKHQLSANAASVAVAEPLNNVAPTISSKTSAVQVEIDSAASIACLAQGFPVPEIRYSLAHYFSTVDTYEKCRGCLLRGLAKILKHLGASMSRNATFQAQSISGEAN